MVHKVFAVLEDRFGAMLHDTVKEVSYSNITALMQHSHNISSAVP